METAVLTPARGARAPSSLAAEATLTLVAMFIAFLALDDITTDNATGFRPEYSLLALAGAWLLVFVVQLWRNGRSSLAVISLVFLIAAAWVIMDGIGHERDGGWIAFWPEYSTVTAAWLSLTVIAGALLVRGLRRGGAGRSSR